MHTRTHAHTHTRTHAHTHTRTYIHTHIWIRWFRNYSFLTFNKYHVNFCSFMQCCVFVSFVVAIILSYVNHPRNDWWVVDINQKYINMVNN